MQTRIRIPNPMATLYYGKHVHITQTQTRIPIPYFCTGQESESESVSSNVNEPLITGGRSHQKKAKMVAIRLKLSLYVPSTSPFAVSGTCDLLNIVCEQHHITTLNPFLNGKKKTVSKKCEQGVRNSIFIFAFNCARCE